MINEIDLSEGWRLMELKNICLKKAEYGSGAKAIDFEYKKPRYVRITDIDDNGNLKKDNIVCPDLVEEKYFLEENDLLFARSGSVGKTYLYKKRDGLCQFAGYLIRFKPNPAIIDSDYLNYVVKSPHYWNWVESKKKTMTISNINAKQYSGLKIPVPPLKTQNKIVEFLEKAGKLKEWRAEADELADAYLESVFLEMFGDPIKNEKGWRTLNGEDYCKKISVGVVIKPASYYVDEGIIALRSLNIKPNRFNLNDLVYFSSEDHLGKLSKSILRQGDVVLVRTGLTGTAAVIPKNLDGCNCIDLIIASPNKDLIHPVYLAYFFNSENGKNLVLSKEVGGIQKHFNVGAIKKLKIPIPPLELQNQFAQIVQQVETLKTHQSKSKQEIDNLFNILMQKAFKGELVC